MTLEQKVGQLMIWSFQGQDLTPELQRTLTKYQPGALIVFRRNIKAPSQIAQFNRDLQKFASQKLKAPLFLMIDQEGGLVTRIRTSTPMPSALALARMDDEAFVENYAQATADMLKLLGFNVNLAPVLDISNPHKDSFIGNRTFGNDPDTVAEMTMAYSRGMSAGGVIPTAKHFPGHGGTMQDSHHTTPKKMVRLDELSNRDFVPFSEFTTAAFPKAVMMAHLALPNVDPSGLPATYSKTMIQDHLRGSLEYGGLVITDDLEMSGASFAKDLGERAVKAFQAGNDMVMLAGPPANQRKAFAAILKAVKSGKISRERLDESVKRILAAKAALTPPPQLEPAKVKAVFNKLDTLSKEVLKRNFKFAADEAAKNWPDVKSDTRVTVYSASYLFYQKFQKKFTGKAKYFRMSPTTLDDVKSDLSSGRADISVFFASGSKTAHWLNTLSPELKSRLIVVNCNHPGEIDTHSEFMSLLNVNTYFTDSGTYLAELLNRPIDHQQPNETPALPAPAQATPVKAPAAATPATPATPAASATPVTLPTEPAKNSPFSEDNEDLKLEDRKPAETTPANERLDDSRARKIITRPRRVGINPYRSLNLRRALPDSVGQQKPVHRMVPKSS